MPFKNKEKDKQYRKEKIGVSCVICGKKYSIRRDSTYKKKYKRICYYCKNRNKSINENEFVNEYLKFNSGYQSLCKKFKIGGLRGKEILQKNNIKILDDTTLRNILFNKGLGKWKRVIKKPCKVCGELFKFRKNGKEQYCSIKCRSTCLENRQKIREATLKQISNGSFKTKDTLPERIFEKLLQKNKINYIKQFVVGFWAFDFYVSQYNLLVEVDGDYWHANPKKYSVLNATQQDISKRAKAKDNYARSKGYSLLRFWESDLKNNLGVVESELLQNCK